MKILNKKYKKLSDDLVYIYIQYTEHTILIPYQYTVYIPLIPVFMLIHTYRSTIALALLYCTYISCTIWLVFCTVYFCIYSGILVQEIVRVYKVHNRYIYLDIFVFAAKYTIYSLSSMYTMNIYRNI